MKRNYITKEDLFKDRLIGAVLIRACKDYILLKKHHLSGIRGIGSIAGIRAFMKDYGLLWVLDKIDKEMENGNDRFLFKD